MAFYPLEKLHFLHEGYRRCFQLQGKHLLLIEESGHRFLIDNHCPHAGYPLHEATLEGDTLRCPLHGIAFNLFTGQASNVNQHAAEYCLNFYHLEYREDVLGVELP